MNLHIHPDGSRERLYVFVHGLGGYGYESWGRFPEMLFDGTFAPPLDVAIYDYPSFRRTKLMRGVDPQLRALSLAGHIKELVDQYQDVVLIAHSMGGLISMEAGRLYLGNVEGPLTGIAAIFLFGSPRGGSGWAVPPLRNYNRELPWLTRKSKKIRDLDQYYQTSVHPELIANRGQRRILMPMFICAGDLDIAVNPFSSMFGHSDDRILVLQAGHGDIAKPTITDHSQVDWLIDRMAHVTKSRLQVRREISAFHQEPPDAPPPRHFLISELWTDNTGTSWHEIYNDIRRAESLEGLPIIDALDCAGVAVDLHISLHRSDRITSAGDGLFDLVMRPLQSPTVGATTTVTIAPVGTSVRLAEHALGPTSSWVRAAGIPARKVLVEGAIDDEALVDLLTRWLRMVAGRDPRRSIPMGPPGEGWGPSQDLHQGGNH